MTAFPSSRQGLIPRDKNYRIDKEDISRVSIPIDEYMELKIKQMLYDQVYSNHHKKDVEYAVY